MRCDKCKFWELSYEFIGQPDLKVFLETPRQELIDKGWVHPDDREGRCHRYPPQMDAAYTAQFLDENCGVGGSEASSNCWGQPLTTAYDWCGEFKPT